MALLLLLLVQCILVSCARSVRRCDPNKQLEPQHIGVFILMDSLDGLQPLIRDCAASVGAAAATMMSPEPSDVPARRSDLPLPYCLMKPNTLKIDVVLGLHSNISSSDGLAFKETLGSLPGIASVSLSRAWGDGDMHLHTFFDQVTSASATSGDRFKLALKLRTDVPRKLLHHSVQSLCGTPSHVISIWQEFVTKSQVALIAPQGTAVHGSTSRERMLHILRSKAPTFDYTEEDIQLLNQRFHMDTRNSSVPFTLGAALSVRGEMYWTRVRPLHPRVSGAQLAALAAALPGAQTLRALALLVPSLVVSGTRVVHEMAPAPKPMAIYFPQYHRFAENDRFWGEGFTEWTLLKPLTLPSIMKPLGVEQGGLGYYDLTDRSTRLRQAALNREFGGHGFMYYHYWFSGDGAPADHKVMYKIPELMLLDGEPAAPFMFSWANEPWTRRWSGTGSSMLAQDYGNVSEWTDHFNYLLQFFKHPNYVKTDSGKPMFAIYRAGHLGDKLVPMLTLWDEMARSSGFANGLNFIYTINSFSMWEMRKYYDEKLIESAFQFCPMLRRPHQHEAFGRDVPYRGPQPQYWCAATGFDRRPRDNTTKPQFKTDPIQFWKILVQLTDCTASVSRWSKLGENLLFLTAWNEWNEQAILEPNNIFGNGYLTALKNAMQSVESCSLHPPTPMSVPL
jgi:hypothetical protein